MTIVEVYVHLKVIEVYIHLNRIEVYVHLNRSPPPAIRPSANTKGSPPLLAPSRTERIT